GVRLRLPNVYAPLHPAAGGPDRSRAARRRLSGKDPRAAPSPRYFSCLPTSRATSRPRSNRARPHGRRLNNPWRFQAPASRCRRIALARRPAAPTMPAAPANSRPGWWVEIEVEMEMRAARLRQSGWEEFRALQDGEPWNAAWMM